MICFKYLALAAIALSGLVNIACSSSTTSGRDILSDQTIVRLWSTSQVSDDDSSDVVNGYGSTVLVVENKPVEFQMYFVDDGQKSLKAKAIIDPDITPFITVNQAVYDELARVEFSAPQQSDIGITESHIFEEVTFPVPHVYGISMHGSGSYLLDLEPDSFLMCYWIHEDENTALKGVAVQSNIDLMLKESKKQNVSFVVITASPVSEP